ncbi:hypothetical protein FA13DRAFT_1736868 [Coprinellus micaceus]|uniref:Uncharacterized protein n=1 Tax=Coprinellus micaceus TaxID=71717 RepID=A0A4Y7SYZ2_COPMI|nr:hypothetical protein FA13DRAFT_1736868 [Coprinellus micaceus]
MKGVLRCMRGSFDGGLFEGWCDSVSYLSFRLLMCLFKADIKRGQLARYWVAPLPSPSTHSTYLQKNAPISQMDSPFSICSTDCYSAWVEEPGQWYRSKLCGLEIASSFRLRRDPVQVTRCASWRLAHASTRGCRNPFHTTHSQGQHEIRRSA